MSEQIYPYQNVFTELVERHAKIDGIHKTAIPSLFITRFSYITGPHYSVHKPSLCIIAQGLKQITLTQDNFIYSSTEYILASVDLPISGQVIAASQDAPYLAIKLEFTSNEILEVLHDAQISIHQKDKINRGLSVNQIEVPLFETVMRLLRLLEQPNDILILAPLIKKEIIYRLLQGKNGEQLKQMAIEESSTHRISDAIQYIMNNFHQPFRVEDLAETVNLSVSTFHRQFKEITSMSPIQFQKQLRLQEARRLLLTRLVDATEAAFQVGYESPSQFSREYSRMFGLPPREDIKRLKNEI